MEHGYRLRLYPLRGINEKQSALASGERAGYLPGKVNVSLKKKNVINLRVGLLKNAS